MEVGANLDERRAVQFEGERALPDRIGTWRNGTCANCQEPGVLVVGTPHRTWKGERVVLACARCRRRSSGGRLIGSFADVRASIGDGNRYVLALPSMEQQEARMR